MRMRSSILLYFCADSKNFFHVHKVEKYLINNFLFIDQIDTDSVVLSHLLSVRRL